MHCGDVTKDKGDVFDFKSGFRKKQVYSLSLHLPYIACLNLIGSARAFI